MPKRISNKDKAIMKMDAAIWRHGKRRAEYTICINKLKRIEPDEPIIVKAIEFLQKRLIELKRQSPL